MRWWCAATSAEWTWAWRAYPGVWLAMLAIAAVYLRRLRHSSSGDRPPHRPIMFALGWLVLWAALDWPIGALGSGYLLSVHTAQYVLLTLVAAPLLLLGVPPPSGASAAADPGAGRLLGRLAHPGVGMLCYIGAMGITHAPEVSDSLMASQLGSFAVDFLWLLGGFGLWWPVLAPAPHGRLAPPVRIGYLFLATIPPTVPAAFMVFAAYPLYGIYELAPRVAAISAATDQQIAGVTMKAAMDPILWIAMAIVFFRWNRLEERVEQGLEAAD